MLEPLNVSSRRRNGLPLDAARWSIVAWITVGCLVALPAAPSRAEGPASEAEQRGLEIAREADRLDQGFGDLTANLEMILKTRRGQESRRRMRVRTLEVAEDGDKTLVIFDEPKDVQGTALLTFSHKSGDDDQWLYLPALKRVKRISSSNRSGPFMGSEFAYEDLSSQEVEEFTYRYLRDEDLDGQPTYVIERFPKDPKSGYTRQVVWLDQEAYRALKIDYYDRKETLLKTLEQSEFQQYLGRHWRPGRMHMTHHQNGKVTDLLWTDFAFKTGLKDGDFDRNSLARAK